MSTAKDLAEQEFKQGINLFRSGYYAKALEKIRHAVELDRKNPLYISYMGLMVALAQKNYEVGEQLCHRAVGMNRRLVQSYLNLAEVYIQSRRKEEAVEALMSGLPYTRRDARLLRALGKLGVRRPPILPFLDRRHFLNRHLGRLRHRVLQMIGQA